MKNYLENPIPMPQTADGWTILNATSDCFFCECDKSGMQLLLKDEKVLVRECNCKVKEQIINNFDNANIPILYKNITVESFNQKLYQQEPDKIKAGKAKAIAIDYVQNFEKHKKDNIGLYLFSKEKGTGKTHLAISILIALIKFKEVKGLYCSEYEILDSIKSTFNSSSTSTKSVINKYSLMPVLVIDDFGMEKQTEWVQQTFTKIIDERLCNNRLTIFTSNLTYKEIRVIYKDGRLPSRLESMTLFIEMPEEDIRVKLAQQKKTDIIKNIIE